MSIEDHTIKVNESIRVGIRNEETYSLRRGMFSKLGKNEEERVQDLKFVKKDSDKAAMGACCGEGSDSFLLPARIQRTCGFLEKTDLPPWAMGTVTTPVGTALKVSSDWSRAN